MVAVRLAALISDESALEACLRGCAIQIDDLYLFYPVPGTNHYCTGSVSERQRNKDFKISLNFECSPRLK